MLRPSPIRAGLLALAFASSWILVPHAYARWSALPVEVHVTLDDCAPLAACSDGAFGAIVVWQELTQGGSGVLRARHVLVAGDVDPAWPSPAEVCTTIAARAELHAIGDGAGGAYVWWMEGESAFLTRLAPQGVIAGGWPERGRLVCTPGVQGSLPRVLADGSGGLYVTWIGRTWDTTLCCGTDGRWLFRTYGLHIGPTNSAAAGWTASARIIGDADSPITNSMQHAIGLAPDGGLWVLWATLEFDLQGPLPGDWRIKRLQPSGVPAAGWAASGTALARYPGEFETLSEGAYFPLATHAGVASDGTDGAFAMVAMQLGPSESSPFVRDLHYVDGAGAEHPGWPLTRPEFVHWAHSEPPASSSILLPLAPGGVAIGTLVHGAESNSQFEFVAIAADGVVSQLAETRHRSPVGLDFVATTTGRLFLANCLPSGAIFGGIAGSELPFVGLSSSRGEEFYEPGAWPGEPRFNDVALAPVGDDGACLFWSQRIERHGVYALRFNSAGMVTDVSPVAALAPRLSLRFAPGDGVRVRVGFAGAGEARVLLADVTGRAVAREVFEAGAAPREWTLAGTASLAPGLYFAQVTRGGEASTSRVVVTR